ncbi:MAG TPA: condensation domain-containing protein, partial [Longimicrobiaceae bacterium]|nr:condensation domain-containing protein [Longimicrobiaceae bacterium]
MSHSESSDRLESLSTAKLALLKKRIRRSAGEPRPAAGIPRRTGPEPAPLSYSQERIWFLGQIRPDNTSYSIPLVAHLRGPLDVPALRYALGEVVRRHEVLRTVFATREGRPVQWARPAAPFDLPVDDLGSLAGPRLENEVGRRIQAEVACPFDLARGPLLRARVLRLAGDEHVLTLVMHHIASDGWSISVLFRELTLLYRAHLDGTPAPLPELPIQYADYAVWQRDHLSGEVLERQLGYWRERLAGAPAVLELPTDRPRPAVQSYRGALQRLEVEPRVAEALRVLARGEGTTFFVVLLAGFQALLSRYSGQEDICVGTPVAGRNRVELEGLIGFFVNTLVIRTDLSGDPTFHELLGQARATMLGAHAHPDLPFEKLVEELQP